MATTSKKAKKSGDGDDGRMELFMWGGGWGLPSIDPESLQALATVRFSGAPTTITECNNPWLSPKAVIPFFKQSNSKCIFSAHEVGLYLRSKNFSGDYGLTSIQCAETVAYGQLIWEGLHVAYQYFFWLHEQNFSEIVRPFYGRRMPWVYKLWYPEWRLKTQAKQVVVSIYRDAEEQPSSVEQFVVEKAKKCIVLLSQKLGTNEFFMGTSSPTTMDAVVFSYLAVFLKVALRHNPLKETITSNANLDRYMTRILQRYFPVSPGGIRSSSSSSVVYDDDGKAILKDKDEESFSLPQKIGAGLIATLVMLLYALKNGIVRLPGNAIMDSSSPSEDDEDYWE